MPKDTLFIPAECPLCGIKYDLVGQPEQFPQAMTESNQRVVFPCKRCGDAENARDAWIDEQKANVEDG